MSLGAAKSYLSTIASRRSYYALKKESTIPDSRVVEIVQEVVKHTPSSFNSQSTRAVVVFGDEHVKVWDFVLKALKPLAADEVAWSATEAKVNNFRSAYGSVLFFEDQTVVKGLQEKFALYADRFPQWSEHTSGAHQIHVWTALEAEGLGANLQHYNPLIDEDVRKAFDLPESWTLKSQLVFGTPAAGAGDKELAPIEERVKAFGAKN